jgi:hypothetical protein
MANKSRQGTVTPKMSCSRHTKYSRQLVASGVCCLFLCGHQEPVLASDVGAVRFGTLKALFPQMADDLRGRLGGRLTKHERSCRLRGVPATDVVPAADDIQWRRDLARGLGYEQHVAGLLVKRNSSLTFASNSNSTHDLKDSKGKTYECKFDEKQKNTGNYFIEYASSLTGQSDDWQMSGIATTRADYYVLGDYEESYLLETLQLKTMVLGIPPPCRIADTVLSQPAPWSKGYLLPKARVTGESVQID